MYEFATVCRMNIHVLNERKVPCDLDYTVLKVQLGFNKYHKILWMVPRNYPAFAPSLSEICGKVQRCCKNVYNGLKYACYL